MASILIVDDNENHRSLIEQELSDEGYHVMVARNYTDALKSLKRTRPDLVITDIAMPGEDGIELLQDILATDHELPVILYTGYSKYESVFMSWAADAYILKSCDLTELKNTISRLLTERAAAYHPQERAAFAR